jgi:ketosteroid isomerase-like protein
MIDISGKPEQKSSKGPVAVLCVFLLVAAAAVGGYKVIAANTPAPVNPAAIELTVRSADMEWAKAAGAHSLTAIVSYYSDGAVMLPPNAPMATDAVSIRKQWAAMLTPDVDATWTPGRVEVATAGDLVYDVGTYTAITRATKKTAGSTDTGKYMSIWKKQADGSWKVTSQIWNSDLPAAGAKKK